MSPVAKLCCCFLLLAACATSAPQGPPPTPLSYRVGPYEEYATLYEPRDGMAPGQQASRRPLVLLLHGGFFGDDKESLRMAQALASQGVLAAVPSYRGEKRRLDGRRSQGQIEFCGGEVDDTLTLIQKLSERPDVDPERVGLLGSSHGGCIALRAAERDPHLRAVVTFSAPTDAGLTYRNLHEHPLTKLGFGGWLASRMSTWVGGKPESQPERWAARSPLNQCLDLTMPLVLAHGTADDLVPVRQACMLRDTLRRAGRRVIESYFDKKGNPDPAAKPVCPEPPPPEGPLREDVPPAQLWYYAGQGHTFSQPARDSAHERALRFLLDQLLGKDQEERRR